MASRLLKGPFTVDAYQRLAELGVLRENDRVELIAGQVVEMTPLGPRHAACVDRLTRGFSALVADRAIVRVQSPIVLGRHAAPQPDVALLRPPIERYADAHPGAPDVLLVVEVADTSGDYDRSVKMPLYARAGIPEAWLVNLPADRIQVYRDPAGGEYSSVRFVSRGDTITPLHFPTVTVAADDILG